MVQSTPVAFRWPIAGETWYIRNINGTFYLDSPVPIQVNSSTDITTAQNTDVTTINDVAPGDVVLNSPTGKVWVLGDNTGANDWSFTEATFNAPRAPDGAAGGVLSGTYPNPTLAAIKRCTATWVNQSLTSAVAINVPLTFPFAENVGGFTLNGAGTGVIVPTAGVYDITVVFRIDAAGVQYSVGLLYQNATILQQVVGDNSGVGGTSYPYRSFAITRPHLVMTAGDVITLAVQTNGAAGTLVAQVGNALFITRRGDA